jgi:hypothetical protein
MEERRALYFWLEIANTFSSGMYNSQEAFWFQSQIETPLAILR